MSAAGAAAPSAAVVDLDPRVDLRRAPLGTLRALDFRSSDRDFWSDEDALWDRFVASWAGLDDEAWRLPGAAPSDAGGPDWSLLDHVGHLVDWMELATEYVGRVLAGGAWPADADYDGGDFDRFNERRRAIWASLLPWELRERAAAARDRLLPLARRLSLDTIRGDDGWGWVWMVLHGHVVDHLTVIEPWADRLRERQIEGDPFTPDPRPFGDGSVAAVEAFWSAEESIHGMFASVVRDVPDARWSDPGPTPEWSLKDHVAHLARWFEECTRVIARYEDDGDWWDGPAEGVDAWNAREAAIARDLGPAEALHRFEAGRSELVAAARSMELADLTSAQASEWLYECLHGHVRAHLAMVGPWCARLGWPRGAG